MDPTTLLNRPKPKVTAHVTKINSLVESSDSIKKSSTKLRRVFEKGTYQKKTQLTVLNRYKRRLDSIQKQNDKRFVQKKQVKMKLPDIKKYTGNLFTAGSTDDPFKALAALAAFRSFQKGSKGDWGGALGSGLVAAGLLFGPSLLGRGVSSLMNRGGGGATAAPGGSPSAIGGRGTPYSQTKAGKAYAGMQAQRNLPGWAQRAAGGSASRFAASNERIIQGTANIGDKARVATGGRFGIGNIAERIATRGGGVTVGATTSRAGGSIAARAGGVGARLLGPVFNIGLSAYRFSQGDYVGGVLSALSAIPAFGWAAVGIDLAREFGVFDGTFLGRKGKDKLKKQTEQQKKLVEKKQESKGELTFSKTLNRYEKVVSKFQEFAKNFKLFGQEDLKQTQQRAARVENLIGNQDIIEEPGYEFTNYTAQYLTGDPNSPAFDESHGTSSNYHDHIAFSDRETAIRAYQYLESKGLDVTEFQGFDPVRGHSDNSYHYSGLAFDVPGHQWGATGPIDQRHYNGSRLVRKYLNEFFQKEKQNNPNLQSKGSQSQRRQPPPQQQSISPIFQQPNAQRPAGLSIGPGGFNIGGRPAAQMSTPKQPSRPIATNLPYQSGYAEPTIVPYPIVQQMQQQMMAQGSSGPVIISGPSEEQLLNSFYKKVLLNTLK